MGVDHYTIFAYGFLLRPFNNNESNIFERIDNFTYQLNKDKNIKIRYATDAYYSSETFIYIQSNGFQTCNRGYNIVDINSNLSISFTVTKEQFELLNKVKEEFKEYLLKEDCGWKAFYYAR